MASESVLDAYATRLAETLTKLLAALPHTSPHRMDPPPGHKDECRIVGCDQTAAVRVARPGRPPIRVCRTCAGELCALYEYRPVVDIKAGF